MLKKTHHRNVLDRELEKEDITLLIAKARALSLKITDVQLKEHNLDLKHYGILSALESSVAPSQKELADYLNVAPRRIAPQLKKLESGGYILRGQGSDRRSQEIEITAKGRDMLAECRHVVAEAEQEYLRRLTTDQRDELRDLLLAIVRSPALDFNLVD